MRSRQKNVPPCRNEMPLQITCSGTGLVVPQLINTPIFASNLKLNLILKTEAPQGWVLSPLLYSLFTHDCVDMHTSNSIKFADDTTVVDLITNNDETAYREEVRELGVWCQANNLSINVNKTLQETAAGAPHYPNRRDSSVEGGKLRFSTYTSRIN